MHLNANRCKLLNNKLYDTLRLANCFLFCEIDVPSILLYIHFLKVRCLASKLWMKFYFKRWCVRRKEGLILEICHTKEYVPCVTAWKIINNCAESFIRTSGRLVFVFMLFWPSLFECNFTHLYYISTFFALTTIGCN